MFRRDYIMRTIEQLAAAVHEIIRLKSARQYDEAEITISRTGQQLLGLDMELLRLLSDEAIIGLLKRPDMSDVGAYIVAAELMREQGEIDEIRRVPDDAYDCHLKSLVLYLEVCTDAPELCSEDFVAKVAFLTDKLAGYLLPEHIQRKLLTYFELRGDFAQAENLIFHLAERRAPEAPAIGTEFYARLRNRTDEELSSGGLPRAEMEEGFLAFWALMGEY